MSVSSDSAEQLMRLYIDETEFLLKITGSAIKNIAAALYVASKDTSSKKGKARLKTMLKSEKELKIFSVKRSDMRIFANEAKSYGVLYCVLKNKEHQDVDDMIDIMVRADDAPKVNRIIERYKLNTIDKATVESTIERAIKQEKLQENNPKDLEENTPDLGVEKKDIGDSMIDDIFEKPIKKEEKQIPLEENQMEKSPQLENSSMSKNKLEGTIKPLEKRSVKKDLKEIRENQKAEEEMKKAQREKNINEQNPIQLNEKVNNEPILKNERKEKIK